MKPCQPFTRKNKAPKKRERKRNTGQGPKSRQANSSKEGGTQGRVNGTT